MNKPRTHWLRDMISQTEPQRLLQIKRGKSESDKGIKSTQQSLSVCRTCKRCILLLMTILIKWWLHNVHLTKQGLWMKEGKVGMPAPLLPILLQDDHRLAHTGVSTTCPLVKVHARVCFWLNDWNGTGCKNVYPLCQDCAIHSQKQDHYGAWWETH